MSIHSSEAYLMRVSFRATGKLADERYVAILRKKRQSAMLLAFAAGKAHTLFQTDQDLVREIADDLSSVKRRKSGQPVASYYRRPSDRRATVSSQYPCLPRLTLTYRGPAYLYPGENPLDIPRLGHMKSYGGAQVLVMQIHEAARSFDRSRDPPLNIRIEAAPSQECCKVWLNDQAIPFQNLEVAIAYVAQLRSRINVARRSYAPGQIRNISPSVNEPQSANFS